MNAISATRRTIRREWTAFGALLIISVGLMGVSGTQTAHDLEAGVNWVASPVETFLNNFTDTLGSYVSALTQIDRLRTQNEQLKQDNLTLQEELNRMPAISRLQDDWTKITAEQGSVPYASSPVRVIVRNLSDVSQRTLVIDKGSNDGLIEGQVVIDAGGALVGRIITVDPTVSSILLISDTTATVIGLEAKSGATGTIQGSVSGQLKMSSVDVGVDECKLLKGNSVVTAGESLSGTFDTSPYPPGLLIGTISDTNCDPNAVVQSATITPAAHLADATFLLVVTGYQGGFGPAVPASCLASPSPGASGSGKIPTTTGSLPVPSGSPAAGASAGATLGAGQTCPPIRGSSPTPRPTATPVTGY